jgi:hypothetical protein
VPVKSYDMFPEITPGNKVEGEPIIRRFVFDKNWNNKLFCQKFIVIAPTSEKLEIGEKLDIRIRDRFFCYATISDKKSFKLSEIISFGYSALDSGLEPKEFLEFMAEEYNKRKWWNGVDTEMQVMFFTKIEQLNIQM